ncbi:MAG: hypothetical protein ACFFBL_00430 [Promethearchaeota archaeon]
MELENIRSKSEEKLMYRRGRKRNYLRFQKVLEKYREKGEPLNLDDVVKYMGVSHHSLRNYAKDLDLNMIIMTDEEGVRWVAFKKKD